MPTRGSHRPRSRTETIRVRLRKFDQDFDLEICTRDLQLDPPVTIQYYWMDSSALRALRGESAFMNFRNTIGHWWAAMQAAGRGDDLDQQVHFVAATCYALVMRDKSIQNVCRDAYLRNGAELEDDSSDALPDDVRRRIREITWGTDPTRVAAEFREIFGVQEPPRELLPAMREAFRHWMGKGIVAFQQNGAEGLLEFLPKLDYWIAKFRKRSSPAVRMFLNYFAYQCKVSFHLCYANLWISLIPWLREHYGLDEVSERFLRFWHMQQQPVEIPHGHTVGGIIYPTQHGVQIANEVCPPDPAITWRTEQIGPTHLSPTLHGQVLSLHPLSGFFMRNPGHRLVAARFFATDAYDEVFQRGRPQLCPEYWDLIGSVLEAGHQYRRAWEEQEQGRGTRTAKSGVESLVKDEAEPSLAAVFEDCVRSRGECCAQCRGELRYFDHESEVTVDDSVIVQFTCANCGAAAPSRISQTDLATFLTRTN